MLRASLIVVAVLASAAIVASVGSCSDAFCDNCPDGVGMCYSCVGGYILKNGACQACPAGYISADGVSCARLSTGAYRTETSTSAPACAKGRWGGLGSTTDQCSGPCMSGTYNQLTYTCGGGGGGTCTYSYGSPWCRACDDGTYARQGDGADTCGTDNYCGQSTYSLYGGTASLYNGFSSTTCFACPAGRADATGPAGASRGFDATCSLCVAGKYSTGYATNGQGDFTCLECTVGRYASGQGAGSSQCEAGCAAGRFGITTAPADSGRTTDQCTGECPNGMYSVGGASGADAANACKKCPKGRYADTTLSTNDACVGVSPAGRYGTVEAAVLSTFSTDAETLKCAAGLWSHAGATMCYACARGYRGEDVAGDAGNVAFTCTGECPAGSFAVNDAATPATLATTASCFQCAVGKYSQVAGSSTCFDCPNGRFGSTAGMTSPVCTDQCAAGRYGLSGLTSAACTGPCDPGRYSLGGATNNSCIACPAGRFAATGATSASCEGICAAGKYAIPGSAGCTNCPAGKFGAEGATSEACGGVCAAGKFSTAGASVCSDCPTSQYSAAGASACISCPSGHYTVGGSTNPCAGTCNPGSFLATNGQCQQCPAGTYSAPGSVGCVECAEGHWSAAGSAQCTLCLTGATPGRPACAACSKTTGLCTACPANSEAVPTPAQGCQYCTVGFGSVAGGSCTRCPTNQYTFGNGAPCSSCLPSSGPTCSACSNLNGQCTACASGNSVNIAFGGCIAVNPVDTTASVPVLSNQLAIDSAARGTPNQQQVLEKTNSREVLMMPVNVPAGQTTDLTVTLDVSGTPVVVTVPASAVAGQGLRVVSFAVDVPPLFAGNGNNVPLSGSVTYYVGTPSANTQGSASTHFKTAALPPRPPAHLLSVLGGNGFRTLATEATGTIRLSLLPGVTPPASLMCGGAPLGTAATSYTAYATATALGNNTYSCPLNSLYAVYSLISVPNTSSSYAYGTVATRLPSQQMIIYNKAEYVDNNDNEIGWGVGLGLGVPLLVLAIVLFACFSSALRGKTFVTTSMSNGSIVQYQ